jgi:hypothetical protein
MSIQQVDLSWGGKKRMEEVLATTFGETGTATAFFGNQWWLVGFFLIIVLLLFFYAYGLSTEGFIIMLISSFLLLQINNLFEITNDYMILITVVLLLFISYIFYRVIDK